MLLLTPAMSPLCLIRLSMARRTPVATCIYKCQLSNAATEPTFSDIQGLSPVFMDEVADAAKMDFSGAGSYVVAHYKAMVRVAWIPQSP